MICLTFLMTSCLTTEIELTGYKELTSKEISALKTANEEERLKALLLQITELSTYVDYLTNELIAADNTWLKIYDVRDKK